MNARWIEIEIDEVIRESDKAFLLRIDGEEHWIPKSQIQSPEDIRIGECEFEIKISEWIADQKGLA